MKLAYAVLFLAAAAMPAVAQDFSDTVNFDATLETLGEPGAMEALAKDGRVLILEGLLGDTMVVGSGDERVARAQLIGGAWIGTDKVVAYRCWVVLKGESWAEAFPAERPRDPGPGYLPANSRLLVACRPIVSDSDIPEVEAIAVRRLD